MTCLNSLRNPSGELRLQFPSPHAQASALPSSNTASPHQTPEVRCIRELVWSEEITAPRLRNGVGTFVILLMYIVMLLTWPCLSVTYTQANHSPKMMRVFAFIKSHSWQELVSPPSALGKPRIYLPTGVTLWSRSRWEWQTCYIQAVWFYTCDSKYFLSLNTFQYFYGNITLWGGRTEDRHKDEM